MSELQICERPLLADYYIDAIQQVYGKFRRVNKKHYSKFTKVELTLLRKGIEPRHYAITVAKLWRFWCEKRNLEVVPINVFLGKKSQQWYDEYAIFAVDVASTSKVRAIVAQEEFRLAQAVIQAVVAGNQVREQSLIQGLELSQYWHTAADNGDRPKQATAEAVAKLFGLKECNTFNYATLGRIISERRLSVRPHLS